MSDRSDWKPIFAGREKIYFPLGCLVAALLADNGNWPWWVAGLMSVGIFTLVQGVDEVFAYLLRRLRASETRDRARTAAQPEESAVHR